MESDIGEGLPGRKRNTVVQFCHKGSGMNWEMAVQIYNPGAAAGLVIERGVICVSQV